MPADGASPGRVFLATHLVACAGLWGAGFLLIKLTDGDIPPFALSAWRGLIATAALMAWFAWSGRTLFPQRHEWKQWAILGTLNGWAPNVLTAFAMTQITTGLGAMIQAAGPLIVAVLAHMLFAEERLSARRIMGVLMGFAGIALLIGPAALNTSGLAPFGALAMLMVAACYATGSIYVRSLKVADPARLALGQQLFSGLPALALAFAIEGTAGLATVTTHLWVLIAMGVLSTAVPIALFMRLVRGAGPTRASMVGYLQPVFAAGLGFLVLGEVIGLREAIGGAIVLAGVWIVSTGRPVAGAADVPPAKGP